MLRTAALLTLSLAAVASQAAPTAGWRGDGSGRFPDATPPVSWSQTSNVVWKTELPDWSNASPVLLGDRIFICVEPYTLMCLSAVDGRILWQSANQYADIVPPEDRARYEADKQQYDALTAQLSPLEKEASLLKRKLKENSGDSDLKAELKALESELKALRSKRQPFEACMAPARHEANGYSSPTPVTDGALVFALFGNGVAACYDLEGRRQWARLVGRPSNSWGHSASPVWVDGVLVLHMGKQVQGLNPQSGETMWTTAGDSKWGTPAVDRVGGLAVVVTTSGDILRVSDGKRLSGGVGDMPYTSPMAEAGVVYVIDQNGAKASRLPATMSDVLELETLWTMKPKKDRYYASPVLHNGIIYAINQQGWLSAIDCTTGELIYEEKLSLKATVYPSITLAGDKLYASGEKGNTVVFAPGRTYKELATNDLEPFRSCPVFSGSRMYVRGKKWMWCIGE